MYFSRFTSCSRNIKLYPQDFTSKWFQINDCCYVFCCASLFWALQTVALCSLQYFSIKALVNVYVSSYYLIFVESQIPRIYLFRMRFFFHSLSLFKLLAYCVSVFFLLLHEMVSEFLLNSVYHLQFNCMLLWNFIA